MAQTAVVTGGTGGLGAAVTRKLLSDGWNVVVPWIEESELERLERSARLVLIEADLMSPQSAEAVVASAKAPLKALANLVGGFAMGGRVHETPIDDFEGQLRLNLRAGYLMAQAVLPHLIEAGGGAVINVSSQAVHRPFARAAGYLTAKTAVLGFTDALHAEYHQDGVRVNAILPGVVDTPANRESQPEADWSAWTSPESIAATIAFLCSEDSKAIRGSHLLV